jgi:BirA family biotin operon repressor/biotin-[acetyl-CoA-carboxylase] ligase
MGMVRDGLAKHGEAWFSYEQTHGKGRRGKMWKAEKGKNIISTIVVSTRFLTVYQQFYLSVAVSLACLEFYKKYAGDETKIKWPNDIFWNDRKAGGILIENVVKGNDWQWAIIGIGININQTEFSVDGVFVPVSLKQITGREYDIIALANELYEMVMKQYDALKNNQFDKMLIEYNQILFGLNKKVKLKKDNIIFETTIKGVSEQGQLITYDAIKRQFGFGEVEWLR